MTDYIIEFGENTLRKTFRTDCEVIEFCEYLIDEYECNGYMHVMKQIEYKDHLGYGHYWVVFWTNK
jgi:hypothetical protein